MTTIVGGICPRCGQFHDLFLAVDGSIVCRNADGTAERIRQLEAERDAARAEIAALREQIVFLERHVGAEVDAGREVLADLRAKVDDRAHRAADIYREEGGTYWEGSMDAYGVVLSFIDEAQR